MTWDGLARALLLAVVVLATAALFTLITVVTVLNFTGAC